MKIKRFSLRFNLDWEDDRRAWEALHRMDAQSINITADMNRLFAAQEKAQKYSF